MSECIYPCGWKKLKSILIKESSFFAIETLDDSVSDGVRKCGISLGNRARDLADYAETQQQRIKDLERQAEKHRDDTASWQRVHRAEYEKREALEQQLKTAKADGVREFCAGLRIIIPERSANISIAMKRYVSSVEN